MANNIWRWTAKDKDGKPVESAPGLTAFESRGPTSESEMRREAQRVLNGMMQLDWLTSERDPNWKNPGYKVDSVEPKGHSDQAADPIGVWQPPEAQPTAMPEPSPDAMVQP